jgi:protein-disulfide isomerase
MNDNKLFIPAAIVIAGLIIGGAIVYTNKAPAGSNPTQNNVAAKNFNFRPIDKNNDHIFGDPNATIKIVEYSDFECPFCSTFHPTMERIMNEYAAQGKVALVYRHFPLRNIHPRAQPAAEASECVAELGGNDQFWKYSKKIFEVRNELMPILQKPQASRTAEDTKKISDSLSDASLKQYATDLGVNGDEFGKCFSEGRYKDRVEEDYQDGISVAKSDPKFGTPYSLVVTKDGVETSISGAQQYTVVKQIIDTVLESKK